MVAGVVGAACGFGDLGGAVVVVWTTEFEVEDEDVDDVDVLDEDDDDDDDVDDDDVDDDDDDDVDDDEDVDVDFVVDIISGLQVLACTVVQCYCNPNVTAIRFGLSLHLF